MPPRRLRLLATFALSLAACSVQPTFQARPVLDEAWVVPSPADSESRGYLQAQMERDPNQSQADLEAATEAHVRTMSALGVKKSEPRGLLEVTVRFPTGELYGLGGYIVINPTGPIDLSLPIWKLKYAEHRSSPWTKLWLPPGEYQVIADSSDYVPSCGVGWTPTLPPFGLVVTTLKVRADETTRFEAVLKAGGRLRLHVQDVERDPRKYAVQLVPDDGPALPLTFFMNEEYPYRVDEFCPGGSNCISENIIPEGAYTLECEAPDGVITRTRVLIGNGKVTELHLAVPPPTHGPSPSRRAKADRLPSHAVGF